MRISSYIFGAFKKLFKWVLLAGFLLLLVSLPYVFPEFITIPGLRPSVSQLVFTVIAGILALIGGSVLVVKGTE